MKTRLLVAATAVTAAALLASETQAAEPDFGRYCWRYHPGTLAFWLGHIPTCRRMEGARAVQRYTVDIQRACRDDGGTGEHRYIHKERRWECL